MGHIWEAAAVLLLAAAALTLGWHWFGGLVTPLQPRDVCTLVRGLGDGGELEQAVRGILWMRDCGCGCGDIVILDLGLSEEGRRLAETLAAEGENIRFCRPEELMEQLMEENKGKGM